MRNFLLNLFLNIGFLLNSGTAVTDDQGTSGNAAAAAGEVNKILKSIVSPCLIALAAMGAIYMVVLGVQYAKSENDNKRADIKKRIVNLAIGVVIIIIMLTLCLAIKWDIAVEELFGWLNNVKSGGGSASNGGHTSSSGGTY